MATIIRYFPEFILAPGDEKTLGATYCLGYLKKIPKLHRVSPEEFLNPERP